MSQIVINMDEKMQVQNVTVEELQLIGFKGDGPKDEKRLFQDLEARKHEIDNQTQPDNTYLIFTSHGLYAAVAVSAADRLPEGMVSMTIPAKEYVKFSFEEKYVGDFWNLWCGNRENQDKYNVDVSGIRFEIFNQSLQPKGTTAMYFPVKKPRALESAATAEIVKDVTLEIPVRDLQQSVD